MWVFFIPQVPHLHESIRAVPYFWASDGISSLARVGINVKIPPCTNLDRINGMENTSYCFWKHSDSVHRNYFFQNIIWIILQSAPNSGTCFQTLYDSRHFRLSTLYMTPDQADLQWINGLLSHSVCCGWKGLFYVTDPLPVLLCKSCMFFAPIGSLHHQLKIAKATTWRWFCPPIKLAFAESDWIEVGVISLTLYDLYVQLELRLLRHTAEDWPTGLARSHPTKAMNNYS